MDLGRCSMVAMLAMLAAGLAACGGSGGKSGRDETAAVAAVIKKAASSTDPADCTRLLTQRFVEQNEIVKGKAALESCREDARDASGNPRSTSVSNVSIDGDTAHARAAFEGGDLDGQAVNMRLVRQRGRWKLDHMDSFARFDRTRFLRAAQSSLRRPPRGLPADAAACIAGRFGKLSDSALQSVFLSADAGRIASLAGPCFVSLFRRELTRQGVPKRVTDCVVAKIDKPPYVAIRRIFLGADVNKVFQPIAQACLAAGVSSA